MRPLTLLLGCLLISTPLLAQLPSYVPTDGLVAWYPFNGNANDESGNGHDGIITGATFSEDRNGNADASIEFNGYPVPGTNRTQVGLDNHVYVPDFDDPFSNGLSISLWALEFPTSESAFLQRRNNNNIDFNLELNTSNQIAAHLGFTSFSSQESMPSEQWTHLTLTYDEESIKLYKDGALIEEQAASQSVNNFANELFIGKYIYYGGLTHHFFFNGRQDDLGIWSRVLTPTEVQSLHQSELQDASCALPQVLANGLAVSDSIVINSEGTLTLTTAASVPLDSTLLTSFSMSFGSAQSITLPNLESNKNYRLQVDGRYGIADGWNHCDAAFTYAWDTITGTKVNCNGTQDAQPYGAWLFDGTSATDWQRPDNDIDNNSAFCSGGDRTYWWTISGNGNANTIGFTDCCYGDNSGSLDFKLFELSGQNASVVWPDGSNASQFTISPTASGWVTWTSPENQTCADSVFVLLEYGPTDPIDETTSNVACIQIQSATQQLDVVTRIVIPSLLSTDMSSSNIQLSMNGVYMPHWIGRTWPDSTEFFIRMASIPEGTSILSVEMNPNYNHANDGTVVFDVFDDFEAASINDNLWSNSVQSGASMNLSSGELIMNVTQTDNYVSLFTDDSFNLTENWAGLIRCRTQDNRGHTCIAFGSGYNAPRLAQGGYAQANGYGFGEGHNQNWAVNMALDGQGIPTSIWNGGYFGHDEVYSDVHFSWNEDDFQIRVDGELEVDISDAASFRTTETSPFFIWLNAWDGNNRTLWVDYAAVFKQANVSVSLLSPGCMEGCTDPESCNYDSEANLDDGSCIPSGCMEEGACNYNAAAECEGEACDYSCCPGPGCCGPGTTWDPILQSCVADTPDATAAEDCSLFTLQELSSGYLLQQGQLDLQDTLIIGLQQQVDSLNALLNNCPGND